VLKVELHAHTADDPIDRIPHTTHQLIDRAAALGYDALAVTLHDRQLDISVLAPYAAERGIVLIPGIERSIEGKHVLLLNFPRGADRVQTFEDLAALRRRHAGLVIAPHPFFPASSCLRGLANRYVDLFDAVEFNAMFTSSVNFNTPALEWGRRHGKPVVGNCDVHRLPQLGTTYSLVDAERHPDAICEAVRLGRVRVEARPLSMFRAAMTMADLFVGDLLPRPLGSGTPEPIRSAYR
jgi:predicted metal-dependent phosphoesterase TrpH